MRGTNTALAPVYNMRLTRAPQQGRQRGTNEGGVWILFWNIDINLYHTPCRLQASRSHLQVGRRSPFWSRAGDENRRRASGFWSLVFGELWVWGEWPLWCHWNQDCAFPKYVVSIMRLQRLSCGTYFWCEPCRLPRLFTCHLGADGSMPNVGLGLPLFLAAIEPHFMRKGCTGQVEIAILPQFLAIEPHFVRKGCSGQVEIAILLQFLAIEPHRTSFRAKGLRRTTWIAILPHFLAIEPHFVRKGCAGRLANRNFTSVFGDRTSFRAKGLRFVPSRWHCPCPRLQERNTKEGEGKRARGQEEKMWRCEGKRARGQEEKIWRCEDVKMWGWEDVKMTRCEVVKMWRWADVKMRRCEDVKMWRWEDVKMRRCEDEKMWRCEDVRMWRCEDEDVNMWRCEDVKMSRWEDVKVWRWADEKMRRWEDVKMRRSEDERCEDVKMRRCEVKMRRSEDEKRRCEEEKMWGWKNVKMRRCEDEKMWGWEDVKMRRCEDEIQTLTIGRTLRSDALGKKTKIHQGFLKFISCLEILRGTVSQETKRTGERRHCKWCAKWAQLCGTFWLDSFDSTCQLLERYPVRLQSLYLFVAQHGRPRYKPDRCHHCRVCCVLRCAQIWGFTWRLSVAQARPASWRWIIIAHGSTIVSDSGLARLLIFAHNSQTSYFLALSQCRFMAAWPQRHFEYIFLKKCGLEL